MTARSIRRAAERKARKAAEKEARLQQQVETEPAISEAKLAANRANAQFSTGRYRFRFIPTPHVPHGWDAGVLFEESQQTLFCSDLFHQWGLNEPATRDSIMERCKEALVQTEAGPFANYVPYTHHTGRVLESLAEYQPKTLAAMHGSTYFGNGAQALRDLAVVMRDVLGPKAREAETTPIGTIRT